MQVGDWRRALFALGAENGFRVANALSETIWRCASDVAKDLGLHIATVQSHLSALESAGIVESRERLGGRPAREYRLRDRRFEFSVVLGMEDRARLTREEEERVLSALRLRAARVSWAIELPAAIRFGEVYRVLSERLGRGVALGLIGASAEDAGVERERVYRLLKEGLR
ncbi:MAG: helix-turn-helix domain-containing protein [Candidatus Thermoplasmatota archaeon]